MTVQVILTPCCFDMGVSKIYWPVMVGSTLARRGFLPKRVLGRMVVAGIGSNKVEFGQHPGDFASSSDWSAAGPF
jgi:hypothetical protein